MMVDAVEFAASLNPVQRDVIEKIGAAGPGGLLSFGWAVNWFTALFMAKKHDGLIVTGRDDNHARLGPFGEKVFAALLIDQSPVGGSGEPRE